MATMKLTKGECKILKRSIKTAFGSAHKCSICSGVSAPTISRILSGGRHKTSTGKLIAESIFNSLLNKK